MKKFLKGFAAFAVIAATMASCKPADSPQSVALAFARTMMLSNFDSARAYVASNSQDVFSQTEQLAKSHPLPDSVQQILNQVTINYLDETKVDDSTTQVNLQFNSSKPLMGQQNMKQTLVLRKENGAWKVDMVATMQKAMKDAGMPTPPDAQQPSMSANDTVPPTPPDTGKVAPAPKTK